MKPIRKPLALSVVMSLGFLLLGGCYTQLALNEDEPANAVETQPVIVGPPPTIIIIQPIVDPPWYSPPAVGVVAPPAPSQPPIRDIGNQRSDAGNERSGSGRSESGGTGVRATGPTRGGR